MKALIWTRHPGDLLGQAIDFLTHGDAQHFGFLRKDGKTVHEAYFPQVRDRLLLEAERPFVRCFDLLGITDALHDAFEVQFDANVAAHIKYDIADLFRYELNLPFPDQSRETICSTYGLATILKVAPDLSPLVRCRPEQASPRDHLITPAWVETKLP